LYLLPNFAFTQPPISNCVHVVTQQFYNNLDCFDGCDVDNSGFQVCYDCNQSSSNLRTRVTVFNGSNYPATIVITAPNCTEIGFNTLPDEEVTLECDHVMTYVDIVINLGFNNPNIDCACESRVQLSCQ